MATIYDLLKKDHTELKNMLGQLSKGEERYLSQMKMESKGHSEAEEMVFYKPLEKNEETKGTIKDS
jgi:hypothetical protein